MELKSAKAIQTKSLHDPQVRIWATGKHSLWDISTVLRSLNVTHTIAPEARHLPCRVIKMGFPQPIAVHLAQRVDGYRLNAVNFISASVAELSDTNFMAFPHPDLEQALKKMLRSSEAVTPMIRKRTAADYVKELAQPSILQNVQSEVYRIQPYALQKETKALVLDFFNSRISVRDTMHQLEKSMKTERLKELFKAAMPLRLAVAQLKFKPVEVVAAETGVSAFDLRYLTRSKSKE